MATIGQALAQAQGLVKKHAVKQVDRLMSNAGIDAWDSFARWVPNQIGEYAKHPGGDGLDRLRREARNVSDRSHTVEATTEPIPGIVIKRRARERRRSA